MAIYYLSARPQTIASIFETGQLPKNLPQWIQPKELHCFNELNSCIDASQISINQMFILVLETPFRLSNDVALHSFTLEKVELNWIQEIVVLSKQAQSLLLRVFKNNCPRAITIKENPISKKRKRKKNNISENSQKLRKKIKISQKEWEDAYKALEAEEKKMETCQTVSQEEWEAACRALDDEEALESKITNLKNNSQPNNEKKKETSAIGLQRLATQDEHIDFLRYALKIAEKSILITSYDINRHTLESAGLYYLINEAHRKRIKIYIYCNDDKEIDEEIQHFFKENKVYFAQTYIHSKILAIDSTLVAVGSFNWLSAVDPRYSPNSQGTILFRGEICKPFIEEFWKHIKNYRNEQYGNDRLVERFESDPNNMIPLSVTIKTAQENEASYITYLATLYAHRDYIRHVFEIAKQEIIICSPFISSTATFTEDLDPELLRNTILREVKVIFVCRPNDPYFETLKNHLQSISPDIILIGVENFHNKTIIYDRTGASEGSFNWLSAVRDRESDYHNHEATFVIEGYEAKILITHFFNSKVGQEILQYLKNNNSTGKNLSQSSIFSSSSALFGSTKNQNTSNELMTDIQTTEDEILQHILEKSLKFMNNGCSKLGNFF